MRSNHSARGALDRLSPEEATLADRPLRELTEPELQRWSHACLRLSKFDPSRLARWRWRRRWRRAMGAWTSRIAGRLGSGPPLCERCGERPPTVHVLYGHGAAELARHFCDACSKLEPPGRFVHGSAP